MMHFSTVLNGLEQQVIDLFSATFAASEGAGEGAIIGGLVRRLLAGTAPRDIRPFLAEEGGAVIGAAIFTRLTYAGDPRTVFLLSPMAVATERQGGGIGQALLRHALAGLRAEGVDVVMTYGDPAFYGRVGFRPLDVADAPAPHPLSQPEGWVGQSLSDAEMTPLRGRPACVAALDDPGFW